MEVLEKHGWTIDCMSPFEIRHEDGSVATKGAAYMVLWWLQLADAGS